MERPIKILENPLLGSSSFAREASGGNFCILELTLLMQLCFQQYRSRLGGKTIQTSK